MTTEYLGHIDAAAWPGVATVPRLRFHGMKAKRAEAEFAAACDKAGITLSGEDPDIRVYHATLFDRIACAGWLGLAEGFMAGEWTTGPSTGIDGDRLVDVLSRLCAAGYDPKMDKGQVGGAYQGIEVPPALNSLGSGDGTSSFGPIFSSGVPTTERKSVKSFVPGAGRGNEPAGHFVDVTTLSDPTVVERADLGDAQLRAALNLLDEAHVHVGSYVLDYPSSGATLPIAAVKRRATVDVLTADSLQAVDVREICALAELESSVHVELLDEPFPPPRQWQVTYDAITSVEKLEHMGATARKSYVKTLDRLLGEGGFIALQTVIATPEAASLAPLDVCRAYVWPALDHMTMEEIHRLVDTQSRLRVIAQTHIGGHYVHGLRLQRLNVEAKLREAAALGYDSVYRRLWVFQLAVREALFRVGALDAVQLKIATRHRRGRR